MLTVLSTKILWTMIKIKTASMSHFLKYTFILISVCDSCDTGVSQSQDSIESLNTGKSHIDVSK